MVMTSMMAMGMAGAMVLAGVTLLGVAMVFLVVLNIANARLHVETDPVVEAIAGVLPNANCGACGFAGCTAYAEAVAKDHGLMGKCGPGGEATVQEIAKILGVSAEAKTPVYAVVHCAAHTGDKMRPAEYEGVATCQEAQMVAGAMGCPYGCLGYGDCVKVCDFDAIHVVDGLATVDYDKCVACGACVKACPRSLCELVEFPEDPMLVIACNSVDRAKDVRGYCTVGCVGCGVCAKLAPNVFQMKQNLAAIDYEKYGRWADAETRKAIGKCPRKAMVFVGRKAAAEQEESVATAEEQ